jgi:hypothetical protein
VGYGNWRTVAFHSAWSAGGERASSSCAAFGKISEKYVKAVHRFACEHKIPIVEFKKGEYKEKLARPYLEAAAPKYFL